MQNYHHGGFLYLAGPGKALVPSLFFFPLLQATGIDKT